MKSFSYCTIIFFWYLFLSPSLIRIAEGVSTQEKEAGEEEIDLWSSNQQHFQKNNIAPVLEEQSAKKERAERKMRKRLKKGLKGSKETSRKERKSSKEITAIRKWAESLTEQDYNLTHWQDSFHSKSASDFFNGYARRISDLWKKVGAKVNFALVGACDGLGDKTIKKLFLPNDHWRGVFVEPVSINVRDIITFMAKYNAAHRALIIRAAATYECEQPTIKMERPLYEEKNASIPHWLRRQIGSILPTTRDHARKEWIVEEVRCVTGKDVLHDWAVMGTPSEKSNDPLAKRK